MEKSRSFRLGPTQRGTVEPYRRNPAFSRARSPSSSLRDFGPQIASTSSSSSVGRSPSIYVAAELTETTDGSPVLAQPVVTTAKGQAFIPFSIEVGQDYPSLENELARLLADARAVVDATQFLAGSGTNAPQGVLTGLSSTSWRVQTTTVAVTAIGDIYALKQAVPARFLTNATFAAHPTVWDIVYRFTGGNSAEPRLLPTRDGSVVGIPKFEWSTMSTGTTTTGQKIMLAGHFKSGFVIADRIGAQVELIPHVFAGTSRFPIGARGLYFYWRTGSTVMSTTANAPLRWLEVK